MNLKTNLGRESMQNKAEIKKVESMQNKTERNKKGGT